MNWDLTFDISHTNDCKVWTHLSYVLEIIESFMNLMSNKMNSF